MSATAHRRWERDLDRLCELANIGAGHAAGALAGLLGRGIWMEVPRAWRLPEARAGRVRAAAPAGTIGILFQVEGGLSGVLAVLLPAEVREQLIERLLGSRAEACSADQVNSALAEAGNILASHALSAVADVLGDRVVPSVPYIVGERSPVIEAAFAACRPGGAALRIDTALVDGAGALSGLLVWLPEPAGERSDRTSRV